MWNASLPLPAALMTPVTVHLGLPVTVTALSTLALAMSAWFASIAFRRDVRSCPAALLGGLVHGFSPAMIAQSSSHLHLHLTLGAVPPPLMLLAVDELLHRQRRNPLLVGAALGALAAAQVLIGQELLAFIGIGAAACGPSRWPRRRSSPAPRCGASPRAASRWWCRSRPPRRPGRWPGRPWPACATACPAATSSVPTPTAGPSSAPSAPGCRAG
jgi:hypothetical protein